MISLSHPSRMRGLKLLFVFTIYHTRKSHPSWMRGLKLKQEENQILTGHVASLVDAWIKIEWENLQSGKRESSHPSRMRGLKQGNGSVGGTEERRIPRGCVD